MVRAGLVLVCLASCTREVPHSTARPVPSEAADTTPKGIAWGVPVDGLRLGIELQGSTLVTHLENVSKAPLVVMSHVATHERQNDWLTVTIADRAGKERVVAFDDDRDKSAPVTFTLAAGTELSDRWNLADWAARARNGKQPFDPAFASMRATYRVPAAPTTIPPIGDKVWSGSVESGRLSP